MTRQTFQEERVWYECDGCGYALMDAVKVGNSKEVEFVAPVTVMIGEKAYHFHNADEHGYACFKWWLEHKVEGENLDALIGKAESWTIT